MKKNPIIFLLLLALCAGFLGAWAFHAAGLDASIEVKTENKENAYDHVMRTGVIRCGYVVWTPFLIKDPNSGQLSGLFHDYVEALGEALHLKIEWTEEMGWSDFPAALNSGRIDAMCGGSWANSARARQIDFTQPILYQPVYAYVRTGDTRFDNNLVTINDPSVTVVVVEGASPALIATNDFPKAQKIQLPQLSSLSDVFVNLVSNKADVAIANPEAALQFEANNTGKIHRVVTKMPLRLFGNSIAIDGGQYRLRRMIDIATGEMLASGQIEKMIAAYIPGAGVWLPVAPPYSSDEVNH